MKLIKKKILIRVLELKREKINCRFLTNIFTNKSSLKMNEIQIKQPALVERYEFSKSSNPILRKFYKKSTINKKIFH